MSSRREPLAISSTSNPRLKSAAALRERKERERAGHILVEGLREVRRALDAGLVPIEVWIEAGDVGQEANELARRCESAGAQALCAAPHVFEKLAMREGGSGIVSIFERPVIDARAAFASRDGYATLVLALWGVEKPGNLGALLRTADGAGVSSVIVLEGGVDVYAPQTIRASLGTVFTQPVVCMDSDALRAACREHRLSVVAAALTDQARLPWEVDLRQPTCILLGSEAHGLPPEWLASSMAIQIPMLGAADSLNVAAAGAIILYEAMRQRHRA